MKRFLGIFSCVLCLAGCSTDDASDIVLFVTPSTDSANGAEKVFYDIYSKTIHDYVAGITISSFDAENGETLLEEWTPGTAVYEDRYIYTAPDVLGESLDVLLEFRAVDNLGHKIVKRASLYVAGAESLLKEFTGLILYSPESGLPDAFSLSEEQPVTSSVSDNYDIYLYQSSDNVDDIPLEWRAKNENIRFVKSNSFDYAKATASSIKNTYRSSQKSSNAADLSEGDIIIVGYGDEAWGVFLIVNIYDVDGSSNDRYVLNYKKIKTFDMDVN